MSKVFLGGTCAESKWREELIPLLKIDYFNPVVEGWTEECIEIENREKNELCDIHLYVITSEAVGCYSIAEAIDSLYQTNKRMVFQVLPDGFDKAQLKSLNAVCKLINEKESDASASMTGDLALLAIYLNFLGRPHD